MAICIRPASMTMVNASAGLSACRMRMTVMAASMGALTSDSCVRVPPNTAAKKPMAMAP